MRAEEFAEYRVGNGLLQNQQCQTVMSREN